jgi:hypothetical protein
MAQEFTSAVRFECTSLKGTNKKGVLPKDENGYRWIPIGGLNIFNSAGQYYTLDGAKELFQDSSQFKRRIQRGALRGEVGHPVRQQGQSMDSYMQRVLEIDPTNVCAHFAKIELNFDDYTGPEGPVVAIMGLVAPSGPHAAMLERSFSNPNENVCFSIRAFTKDTISRGICRRVLKNIITFDYVNEPGIAIAEKFKSPALESLSEMMVTKNQLTRAVQHREMTGVAQESVTLSSEELFESFGWSMESIEKPFFTKWK